MRYPDGYIPGFFNKNSLTLHYGTWGKGANTLICFHGFGRRHEDFIRFTRPFGKVFRIVAVDIFFHGLSEVGNRKPDKTPLLAEDWAGFIQSFIDHLGSDKVWLMGYSLGGRLALKTAELLPHRVGGLYLFAPDGLVVNRWYTMLSNNMLGRSLFRFVIRYNFWLHALRSLLTASGLVSQRTAEFSMAQMRTPAMQWQVYHSWTFLRKIEPDFKVFAERLGPNAVTINLFFGAYDKIIPEKNARKLAAEYPSTRIHSLRSGHILLTAAIGELLWRDGLLQLPPKGE